jgi:hypothetical protein
VSVAALAVRETLTLTYPATVLILGAGRIVGGGVIEMIVAITETGIGSIMTIEAAMDEHTVEVEVQ